MTNALRAERNPGSADPTQRDQRVYIFCESYVQLENTLRVIKHYRTAKRKFVVFLGTVSLLRLFKDPNYIETDDIEVVEFYIEGQRSGGGGVGTKLQIDFFEKFRHLALIKKVYRKHFSSLRGADIYFFCQFFNPGTFYVVKRAMKKNRVHFIASRDYDDDVNLVPVRLTSFGLVLRQVLLKTFFGRGIHNIKFTHAGIATEIDKDVLKRCHEYVPSSERPKWLPEQKNDDLLVRKKEYGVIYYDSGYGLLDKTLDPEQYRSVIDQVFKIISRYFDKQDVCIKYHPTFKPSIELGQYGVGAPNYVPGEWLPGKSTVLLGLFSACLYSSVNGTPISLLNLFRFENDEKKNNMIGTMRRRDMTGAGVLLPNSLEELDRILGSRIAARSGTSGSQSLELPNPL